MNDLMWWVEIVDDLVAITMRQQREIAVLKS